MSYRNERVMFRFMNLPHDVADSLHALTVNGKVNAQHNQPGRYVVAF